MKIGGRVVAPKAIALLTSDGPRMGRLDTLYENGFQFRSIWVFLDLRPGS